MITAISITLYLLAALFFGGTASASHKRDKFGAVASFVFSVIVFTLAAALQVFA